MALCPFAIHQLLPENETQRRITPRVAVLHTHGAKGSPSAVGKWFARPTVHTESHFSIGFNGDIYQFMDTARQADAQGSGNSFCVSIETEDGGNPHQPWTPEQLDAIVRLLLWLHEEHDIQLRLTDKWNGSGVGYHSQFTQWNRNAHACPGGIRYNQLVAEILPLVNVLALTGQDSEDIVDPEVKQAILDIANIARWYRDEYERIDYEPGEYGYMQLQQNDVMVNILPSLLKRVAVAVESLDRGTAA